MSGSLGMGLRLLDGVGAATHMERSLVEKEKYLAAEGGGQRHVWWSERALSDGGAKGQPQRRRLQ